MGIDTMFITKREQTINNSEGAILLQIILQVLIFIFIIYILRVMEEEY